jgi:hypothetical protein
MGLFERMKLSGKEVITETTEPLSDGQKPVLEETADLTIAPSAPSGLLGKRKAEATISRVFAQAPPPVGRRKTTTRKGLGAPGLKPKVNLNEVSGARSSSSESDSTEGSDSSSGSGSSLSKGILCRYVIAYLSLYIYIYIYFLSSSSRGWLLVTADSWPCYSYSCSLSSRSDVRFLGRTWPWLFR